MKITPCIIMITKVLHSVAEFRNNAFELRRTMWREVREEWPFFSEEERSLVRRWGQICRILYFEENLLDTFIWRSRLLPFIFAYMEVS